MAEAGGPQSAARAAEESSDSEPEQEPGSPQKLIRKVSTSGQIRSKTVLKEGTLLKQTNSFQRWKRRYFKLRGRTLYYAQTAKSIIFDEVDLTDASVAESSTKNLNSSFTVITPCRRLILCADSRKEMEEWISALRSVQSRDTYETTQLSMDHFSGMHNWFACSHARPTYCNVCKEALSGVTSHGLSCEVCKFKAHKRCAVRATNNCKWTTLASIGKDIIEDEEGVWMPHQWLEGNLPVSAKCSVCDKTCGSVLRLQDLRCLWCKAMVHSGCKGAAVSECPLGQCKVSVILPRCVFSAGFWKASCPPSCTSPLLVSSLQSRRQPGSQDNQGVKFLRRFKQLLNPAQVFDLMNGGPHLGTHQNITQKRNDLRGSWDGARFSLSLWSWSLSSSLSPLSVSDSRSLLIPLSSPFTSPLLLPLCPELSFIALGNKILYPGLSGSGLSGSLSSGSVVSRLFVNTDPFSCDPDNLDCYTEKCVMNNYFGIGTRRKDLPGLQQQTRRASGEMQVREKRREERERVERGEREREGGEEGRKRDEHPEKCRSRTKNMMWYGVLGTKELLHRTYKNLEQRVLLECDGRPIPLPSLQGIAVLNIPSYAGGTNFWGGTKEDETFTAPSFDDKVLEVVAVFGTMHVAVSRVINLQHHRIAQCRTVKITILGDEGVPVQVDGEAWIQPPGFIRILHKNRTQTLTRDRDKQKCDFLRPQTLAQTEILSEEEATLISEFGQTAGALIHSIREVAELHSRLEQELAHAVNASSKAMDVVYSHCSSPGALRRSVVVQMVSNVKALLSETELLLSGNMSLQLERPHQEQLSSALASLSSQIRRLSDVSWLCPVIDPSDSESAVSDFSKRGGRSAKFRLVPKFKKDKNNKNKETSASLALPVHLWGTDERSRAAVAGAERPQGPGSDQSGPHEEDSAGNSRTSPEQQRQRGLSSCRLLWFFSCCRAPPPDLSVTSDLTDDPAMTSDPQDFQLRLTSAF
ncbi:hypothetical protein WMY93_033414 [Mugilogobius chulae]|uniref:diacylglycerol kinase (ATP) n=1 Tax=Mugilogobius chulae TaxID=88201 RepID=A0AAW0MSW5_9GOBI